MTPGTASSTRSFTTIAPARAADITGKAYSDAYNTAMGLRTGDINRECTLQENAINRALGVDTPNLGLKENAINRDLQAALARAGFADSDANRDLDVAKVNQQAEESATDRLGVGASAKSALGKQYYDYFTGVNDALYNAGTAERDAAEEQRSATQQFQEALKNKKYDDALKLLAAASGSTYPTSSSAQHHHQVERRHRRHARLGSRRPLRMRIERLSADL